jgi:hypothetical protein
MTTLKHLIQSFSDQDRITIFYVILIVLILLILRFLLGRIRSRRAVAALQSFLESVTETKSDDEDYISLKAVLSGSGVDPDEIKLIRHLPGEGRYAKIFGLVVTGKRAVNTWMELRSLATQTNRWPLIMGGLEELDSDLLAKMEEEEASVQDILDRVDKVDIDQWVTDAINREPERYAIPPGKDRGQFGSMRWFKTENSIKSHKNRRTMATLPYVLIGLFPVSEGWKVPAVMKWGGWNKCPSPEIHCAVLRHWGEKHGAELVGITDFALEVKVDRTPKTRDEAIKMATLLDVYCGTEVDQIYGSIEDLADIKSNSPVWYFWWNNT